MLEPLIVNTNYRVADSKTDSAPNFCIVIRQQNDDITVTTPREVMGALYCNARE